MGEAEEIRGWTIEKGGENYSLVLRTTKSKIELEDFKSTTKGKLGELDKTLPQEDEVFLYFREQPYQRVVIMPSKNDKDEIIVEYPDSNNFKHRNLQIKRDDLKRMFGELKKYVNS